ncbi:beta-mannosidase-like [Photinus pyralis]|nr:beta-mannosidase-like [Photinus pyralis]
MNLCMKIVVSIMIVSDLSFSLQIRNLGGTWIVENIQKGFNFNGTVPGGIYSDLMLNNIIGDIFYESEDTKARWVSMLDWNYSRTFSVDAEILSHDNINLVFDGLDTFSTILVNNIKIGISQNMFVRYVFDVTPYLQLGINVLTVQFKSPVIKAKELFKKQSSEYIVPPLCVPPEYNGECHVNHIRKMQASFGWDWGPAFPSMGIWKDITLQAYNSTILVDVTSSITSNDLENVWNLQLNTYFEGNKHGEIVGEMHVTISTAMGNVTEMVNINVHRNNDGEFLWTINMTISKTYVNLWWPNGYGRPSLSTVGITFISADHQERSERIIKIGFRTVELVQNKIEHGRTFYFKINSVPIYMKGSNIIPVSILPELGQNKTHVQFLLKSAKDANMNMLRVWGGGVYESDVFYKAADELGLLIWQDFMFACSMYPVDQDFLKNVADEVNHQVRRLQHHPSVVVWAASNENEAALRQNWYGTKSNFSLYKSDFKKLYVDTIKNMVLSVDRTRPFLTSSPTNGVDSEREGYIAEDPQSHFYGDVHFYNYLTNGLSQPLYPISRFVSEYGYQSLPSVQTLLTATNDSNHLGILDNFLRHRQHHAYGYVEMDLQIGYQFKLPDYESPNFNQAYTFYSQIVQAMSVKTSTEKFRRWRGNVNDIGEGLTMGALYWQLNDVWVAPSWSSIDFKQNWKMLHYFAKRFFAPVIISNELSVTDNLHSYVVSDLMKPIQNVTLTLTVYGWNSTTSIYSETVKATILPGSSRKIGSIDLKSFLTEKWCGVDPFCNCFVYYTLTDRENNPLAPDNFFFPTAIKNANLIAPKLKTSVRQIDRIGKEFEILIETDVIALFVWLETTNVQGRFSDNGFLQVTTKRTVTFFPLRTVLIGDLENALVVTNLLDSKFL